MDYVVGRFESICKDKGIPKAGKIVKEYKTEPKTIPAYVFKSGGEQLEVVDSMFDELYSKLEAGDVVLSVRMSKFVRDKDPSVRLIAAVGKEG